MKSVPSPIAHMIKRKRYAMQSAPNPVAHMIKWGMLSGTILPMLFALALGNFDQPSTSDMQYTLLLLLLFSIFLGGIPGAILGAIDGCILWLLVRRTKLPYTKADMLRQRLSVYPLIFITTLIAPSFLIKIILSLLGGIPESIPIISLPAFIAAVVATYAAHRYLFHLRLWISFLGSGKKMEALAAQDIKARREYYPTYAVPDWQKRKKRKNDHLAYHHLYEQDAETETPVTIEATQANTHEAQ